MSRKPKEVIIVGGPNGAGKSTFALEYLAAHPCPYYSADAIAAQLSPSDPALAKVSAGREFLKQVHDALASETHFVVESTLSGRTFSRWISVARRSNFIISVFFLYLDSFETCISRVDERAKKGGHTVPADEIRRRFGRSLSNFWHIYRPLADHWSIIYNSGVVFQIVAAGTAHDLSVTDIGRFDQFQELAQDSTDG